MPGDPEHEEEGERPAGPPPANDWSARDLRPGVARAARDSSPADAHREAVGEPQVGDGEGDARGRPRGRAAPGAAVARASRRRDDRLGRDDDRAVGVHGRQEHGRERGDEGGAGVGSWSAREEVDGERAHEGEEAYIRPTLP